MGFDAESVEELARRYSRRAPYRPEVAPSALRALSPARVLGACAAPRAGRAHSLVPPPAAGLEEARGAALDTAAPAPDGVVARGVLLDLARFEALPWLPEGVGIGPERLDACAEAQGVTVEPGDAVLVRTGQLGRVHALGRAEAFGEGAAPGLSFRCARWLFEREVVLAGIDAAELEVQPPELRSEPAPLRRVSLEQTGVLFATALALDALAEVCATDGGYAFLFVAPPHPRPGRAPTRPLAVR